MSHGNSNDARLEQKFAHLGIRDNPSSGKPTAGRYVPPHLR
ncbi:14781_t:CDS:2, partial [Racocetra persica]